MYEKQQVNVYRLFGVCNIQLTVYRANLPHVTRQREREGALARLDGRERAQPKK